MKKIPEELLRRLVLLSMVHKAESMNIGRGVAALSIESLGGTNEMQDISFRVIDQKFYRDSLGGDDLGTNYIAVVMSKIAYMMRALKNSGLAEATDALLFGEMPYRGGVHEFSGGRNIFVAFSGATEAQDLEIANFGMRFLVRLESETLASKAVLK